MKSALETAIGAALSSLGAKEVSFTVERPPAGTGAQYATNAALVAAPVLGMSPRDIAAALIERLQGIEGVETADMAGAGFVNITVTRDVVTQTIADARRDTWGRGALLAGKTVLVEYTSPNLFKPLHIGNLVGNILGESLARLCAAAGAEVKRLNYPSDIGLTVAKGVWGLWKHHLDANNIAELGKAYVAGNDAYENNPEAKTEIEDINRALYENSNPDWSALRTAGIETSRRHLDALCKTLGTAFDKEFFESESGPLGAQLVREHVGSVFEESDGAVIYRGESEGLHTRVFLNSQELPTYEAKEVGLFKLKSDAYPRYDISLTVTGSEQKDFFQVVFAAIRKVFPAQTAGKELKHIANGFLRLPTGKMSSRKGNVITGESLLGDMRAASKEKMGERQLADGNAVADAVAVGAVKYAILRQASGKDSIFNPEQSLSMEGDSGPYLQYAHARACSVLRKAEGEGIEAHASAAGEMSEPEIQLLYFPEVVARAVAEYEPHYVAHYLIELAGAFNHWYASERILGTADAAHKLAVVDAVRNTLAIGLGLLGIQAPEVM